MSKTDNTTTQATAKSRPSLMSGLALAGQQYFDTPYNIPSTFGDFYVGSPTAVVSNFVPMPLDFMQEQGEQAQQNYDAALLLAQTKPEQFKQLIQAAPFNQETRDLLIKEYGLDVKPEQWAKELVYNPAAAQKIATDISALGERFKADPRTTSIADEYTRWTEKIMNEPYQTGWANFRDPITGAFKQLDPSKVKAEFVVDDHMEYWNKQYQPKFVARVLESIRTTGDGTETLEDISFSDPRIQTAIEGIAYEMMMDPNPQTSRIMRETMSFGENFDRWKQFVSDQVAEQMYTEKTLDLSEVGTGTGTTTPSPVNPISPTNIYQTDIPGTGNITTFELGKMAEATTMLEQDLQTAESTYRNTIYQALQDPDNATVRNAFDEYFKGGKGLTTDRLTNSKNILIGAIDASKIDSKTKQNLKNTLGNMSASQLLSVYFSNTKDELQEKYKLNNELFTKLENEVQSGMLELYKSGDADITTFLDKSFEELSRRNILEQELERITTLNKSVTNQVISQSDELKKLEKEDKADFDKINNIYNKYGYKLVEEAVFLADISGPSLLLSGKKKLPIHFQIERDLTNNGFLTIPFHSEGNEAVFSKDFERYRNSFNKKANEIEASSGFAVNRKQIDVEGEKRGDYITHQLGVGTAEELTDAVILGAVQVADGKSPYSSMSITDIAKNLNPKFGEKIEKRSKKLIYNEVTGGLKNLFILTDENGNQAYLEGKVAGSPEDHLKIAYELMSEKEEEDRALGRMVLARSFMGDANSSKVLSFFNPKLTLSPNTQINVSVGNVDFTMVTKPIAGSKNVSRQLFINNNGKLEEIAYRGQDYKGNAITDLNIKDPAHAFQIMGHAVATKAGIGGPGGSSTGGKPQPGAKK